VVTLFFRKVNPLIKESLSLLLVNEPSWLIYALIEVLDEVR
jgi:hypothetical protein